MIRSDIQATSAISKNADKILMTLVSSRQPAQAIFRLYCEIDDKDAFVSALIGNLILRHKQWQSGQTATGQTASEDETQ